MLREGQYMRRINTLQQHRINVAQREKISIEKISIAAAITTKYSNTTHSFTTPTSHNVSVVVQPVVKLPTKVADPTSVIPPPISSTTPTPHQSPQQRVHRNITLIVQLRGELGNQLSVLANARITQLLARAKYPHIHIQLIGQHQYDTKWTKGRDDLINCFSNAFHDFDFEGGTHNEEFRIVQNLQQAWLNVGERNQLSNVRRFHFLDSLLLQQEKNQDDRRNTSIPQLPSSVSKYSLPYLTAASFSWIDCLRNEGYYNEMRQWLQFNMKKCCNSNVRSNDNDIVFHYRNFANELRNSKLKGQSIFVEIPPHIAANVAFAAANTRDNTTAVNNHTTVVKVPNIAITSRFETGTDQYVAAFSAQNITSHYVSGQQSGVEGFCYILQAQNEIFGSYQSTYYRWAALLGNATRSRFYMMEEQPLPLQESAESTVRTTETIHHNHRTMTIEKYWYTPRRSW